MKRSLAPALLCAFAAAACTPSMARLSVGAMQTDVDGKIALQNTGGSLNLGNVMHDLDDQLGVGDSETRPYLRGELDFGPHRFKAHGFTYSDSGTSTLANDFGNLVTGTSVDTSFEYANVTASWSWDLMPSEMLRLAPGLQLGWHDLDMEVAAIGFAGFESVDTSAVVPQIYLDAEVDLGYVSLLADLGFIELDAGDADGRFVDFETMLRFMPLPAVDINLGYRHIEIDASGRAGDRDFDADLQITGWFLSGGVRF